MAARVQAILDHISGVASDRVVADSILATILVLGLSNVAVSATGQKAILAIATTESAKLLLEKLAPILHNVYEKAGPSFREAYEKALAAAEAIEGFTSDHPVFCTIIALGVLYLLAPQLAHLLGFMLKGPAPASFAAKWQSMYGGSVSEKSLFAYLQRLGMT
ncbi:hypothetical protein C7974DRAFT_31206 [Boeremia exigua]|uniref:uncharacterized protein n=1 Tax=Boeremia exigua TaxID=749465 RepID=UPI001E8EDB11|nr:uncharacterized protein C7974DRAFT_31206 [Boeremia exigua]KAH6618497.1 hypothetical protein C7974DRAFT_31206 [Boeremia exigua]